MNSKQDKKKGKIKKRKNEKFDMSRRTNQNTITISSLFSMYMYIQNILHFFFSV